MLKGFPLNCGKNGGGCFGGCEETAAIFCCLLEPVIPRLSSGGGCRRARTAGWPSAVLGGCFSRAAAAVISLQPGAAY